MNKLHVRGSSKKGITPVIATIILIAGTLVLALVVGAYTFGLFGTNVKNVELTAGNLSSGPNASTVNNVCAGANFAMTFNNPGGATYISALSLSAGGQTVPTLAYWYTTSSGCSSLSLAASTGNGNGLIAGGTSQLTIYFSDGLPTPGGLASGTTYTYTITFGNGQSITGALVAQ
jgi:flagellin-like protein